MTAYADFVGIAGLPDASAAPIPDVIAGTNFPFPVQKFSATADQFVYLIFAVRGYASGGAVESLWSPDTATSGSIVLAAQIACITPDEDVNVATKGFSTQCTQQDSVITGGTNTKRVLKCSIDVSSYLDSMADGDLVIVKFGRLGSSGGGSDDMSGYANVENVAFAYTEA